MSETLETLATSTCPAGPEPLLADVDPRASLVAPANVLLAPPGPRVIYEASKRLLDVAVAGSALLLLSPVLLVIAAIVRRQDGGPALFAQERVGRDGRHFKFYKFRSMVIDAEALRCNVVELVQPGTLRFKLENDPRITWLGRWLRRTSLDELPQLWNVLTGDMTLVGPRPPLPEEVARYGARERQRLSVQQGITCLWQVRGRSLIPFAEQVSLDLEYIQQRGLLLDLKILALTVPAVLSGRGAY